MEKTIGIIAEDIRIAARFLDEIIGEMLYKNVSRVSKANYIHEVELADGTIYKIIKADETIRGLRLDDVYIHEDVENEFISNMIMPSLLRGNDKLNSKIKFFK